MFQNNELMKKTNSTKKVSGLFVKGQRGRSQSKGPKRDPEASCSFACYFCKKSGHINKNYIKYKEILKKNGDNDSDRASSNGMSNQAGVDEEAYENPCNVLTAELRKVKESQVYEKLHR